MAHRGAGEIRADVTVTGDAIGRLERGLNILRMRIDRVRGHAVTVRPPAAPEAVVRPVRVLPSPRGPVFGRDDEVEQVLAELAAYGSVALQAPPGMGATTVLRHLAHHPALVATYGGAVCLSARGPVPRRPPPGPLHHALRHRRARCGPPIEQLRELLRPVRAAVLLDDVELPAADVAELQYLLPNCGFVLAGRNIGGVMRSVALDGLAVDAAGELLAHVVGKPVERSVVYALWGITRGAPAALVQLGLSASAHPTAEFVAAALSDGAPPFCVDAPQDRRLLGLLGAVPGIELSAEQLTAASGVPDVDERMRRWAGCGLVTVSDAGAYRFAGGELDPVEWGLPQRRAELVAAFATWARRHPERRARRGRFGGAGAGAAGGGPSGAVLASRARDGPGARRRLRRLPAAGTPGTTACWPRWRPRGPSATRPRRRWRCTSSAPPRSAAATWRAAPTCSRPRSASDWRWATARPPR